MAERKKVKFTDLMRSGAYQEYASDWWRTAVIIMFLVCAYAAFFTDLAIGLSWFWVIPAIFFVISILVAVPTLFVFVIMSSIQFRHMDYSNPEQPVPKNTLARTLGVLQTIWAVLTMLLEGFITWKLLVWVGS